MIHYLKMRGEKYRFQHDTCREQKKHLKKTEFPPGLRPAASCQPGKRPSCPSQDVMRKKRQIKKQRKTVFLVGWSLVGFSCSIDYKRRLAAFFVGRLFVDLWQSPCDHTRPSCLAKDFSMSLVAEFLCRLAIGLDTPSISTDQVAYFHSKCFDLAKCLDASATHCKKVCGKQEITSLSFKTKRILDCFPSKKFAKKKKYFACSRKRCFVSMTCQ